MFGSGEPGCGTGESALWNLRSDVSTARDRVVLRHRRGAAAALDGCADVVAAIDINQRAIEMYRANFRHAARRNLRVHFAGVLGSMVC